MKVKDLQRELKKRDLDSGGLKATLLQRLKEYLLQDKENNKQLHEDKDKENSKVKDNAMQEENDKMYVEDNNVELKATARLKRGADTVEEDKKDDANSLKKRKLIAETAFGSPQPSKDDEKLATLADAVNSEILDLEEKHSNTLRIDNFIRPFTLNAVKTLVQELGNFVEDGFWMDAIKTHCYVTYPTLEIAKQTSKALDGKVWPPENGRSLHVTFAAQSAMEVSQIGELEPPIPSERKDIDVAQATQREMVTIDEFFQKTETKPVLYFLPLTDEEVQEKKQRQSQQLEGQSRKRRHRGGRKRNRRARFRH
ncbi:hypothetical protein CCR75_004940 [Bremia lactucae]|uniref:SAP domain-containing protein n=1 Tax=Bremia lactucae TaxID=4779 RepID=A0A976FF39_BRELC|nr:hypothetical protein CCR75_004940 [Bremia lactucae]